MLGFLEAHLGVAVVDAPEFNVKTYVARFPMRGRIFFHHYDDGRFDVILNRQNQRTSRWEPVISETVNELTPALLARCRDKALSIEPLSFG